MRKRMKKNMALLIAMILLVTVSGCSDTQIDDTRAKSVDMNKSVSDETWAIYWYLCGSDLESDYGAATNDLAEMMEVSLPDNVQVIIQTGGTSIWQNETVDASVLERYVYHGDELEYVEQLPLANMGESQTLADFLLFCAENYPADRTAVVFWNHGGGSVTGVAFDELYDFDSLTLDEIYIAFDSVYELSTEAPPFELVGFDTCLMATIDTAYTFNDIASYMVASEELEPGNGWYYSGWLGALANNPGMDGAELGRVICDSYLEGCEIAGTSDEITLSVVDLSKMEELVIAYDNIGVEALAAACADPIFFSKFGRSAGTAESYGGNTPDQGYTNMVDLGGLVRNSKSILPKHTDSVLAALDECIIYKVNGPYRQDSSGLSCYYSFNGDPNDYTGFTRITASQPFRYLYEYELSGELSADGMSYVNDMGYEELAEVPSLQRAQLEDFPLYVDDEACAVLDVGAEIANMLKSVYFQLCYVDEEEDIILVLGRDNDLDADWENGIFKDNFRGVWGAIDSNLVYMEIDHEGDDYNLYSVPILLNEEEYNLKVAYNFNEEAYTILGARRAIDDNGMADKALVKLKPGDKITTLHYATSVSGEDEVQQVPIDTLTVTEQTHFAEEDMGDGTYLMMFEMVDAGGESTLSNMATFTVENGEIYTEVP